MKSIYFILIAMLFSNTGTTQDISLYPWLAKSGKFGYCDSTGKSIIPPRFDDAQPFINGYATVGKKGRYGVIDVAQKIIIPMKYPSAQIFSQGVFNLVITKKEYNAWWRFWQWRFMPEFNILSTHNNGPFLVTKVPKAIWKVQSIPDRKVLYHQKRMAGKTDHTQYWKKDWYPDQTAPTDMQISSSGKMLKVAERLFDHNMKKTAGHVIELIDDNTVLRLKKEAYFINEASYVIQDSVQFQVNNGLTVTVKKQSNEMYPYLTIAAFIFKGTDGKTYLSPDFHKPLPTQVEDYVNATAAEIMEGVITIASIPNSLYFLVLSKELKCLLLDSNGKWNTSIPPYEGLDQLLNNGDLLFTRGDKKGILTPDLQFKDLPFDYRAFPLSFSKNSYSGKDVLTQKYGVYNTAKQAWQVAPRYSFIGSEIVPGVCIYTVNEFYGLLDINTGQEITPAIYNMIENDGRVRLKESVFYINPVSGKEYREL